MCIFISFLRISLIQGDCRHSTTRHLKRTFLLRTFVRSRCHELIWKDRPVGDERLPGGGKIPHWGRGGWGRNGIAGRRGGRAKPEVAEDRVDVHRPPPVKVEPLAVREEPSEVAGVVAVDRVAPGDEWTGCGEGLLPIGCRIFSLRRRERRVLLDFSGVPLNLLVSAGVGAAATGTSRPC